jgi:hypothetical protein
MRFCQAQFSPVSWAAVLLRIEYLPWTEVLRQLRQGVKPLEVIEVDPSVLLRPLTDFPFFHKIAESAPIKLSKGHGAF